MIIPEGKIALGKLAQAMIHGAVVIQIQGNFDAGMALVKEVAAEAPVTIASSASPSSATGSASRTPSTARASAERSSRS